ncbi:MAG: twin-arginine translocase subunit TatB [Magnetococcales bacterium]|nr:twin-arginine translocase subunit TatB [Magnetococcales bacterium]
MFGMGWGEIFLIIIVALLVIGPDKLPEVARGLAKAIRQAQRLVGDIRNSIQMEEIDAQTRDYTQAGQQQPTRVTPDLDSDAFGEGWTEKVPDSDPRKTTASTQVPATKAAKSDDSMTLNHAELEPEVGHTPPPSQPVKRS